MFFDFLLILYLVIIMENNNIRKDVFWFKDIDVKKYSSLNENISVDVAVIGGGISGILCSYFLTEAGYNVTLFEGKRLYSGSTMHTTAHISKIEDYIYQELDNLYNIDVSKEYYKSRVDAISKYDELVKKYNIDCDYRNVSSNFYTLDETRKLNKEYEIMKSFGDEVLFNKDTYIFDKKVKGALTSLNNRCFHPIKFLEGLPRNYDVYEETIIDDIDFDNKELLTRDNIKISFNYCVVCTNFPFLKIKGLYPLKMYKSSSYNNYYKTSDDFKIDLYEDVKEDGITYRSYNGYLIQGGLDNRCGVKSPNLEDFDIDLEKTFNKEMFNKVWFETSCDSITFDSIPYIGRYVKNSDNVYVVTGFNKYGMLNGMVAGMEICSLIKDDKSLYHNIFSPQRKIINGKYLGNHLVSTMKGFVKSNVNLNRRCTHLHGKLFYNSVTKTYECPCHGSRFSKEGKVIDGPAKENL